MNSTRIMDDEEFVEKHKHLVFQDVTTPIDIYNLKKLLTIYMTMYELYLIYNKPEFDYSYISDDYNRIYRDYSFIMIGKKRIRNPNIVLDYYKHVLVLKKRVDISFEKRKKCKYINPQPEDE